MKSINRLWERYRQPPCVGCEAFAKAETGALPACPIAPAGNARRAIGMLGRFENDGAVASSAVQSVRGRLASLLLLLLAGATVTSTGTSASVQPLILAKILLNAPAGR